MPVTFNELERAALHIIQLLKSMSDLETMKIAVIGDLALWYHLPDHRRTKVRRITTFKQCPLCDLHD
jgi:hypothetical protein